MFLQRAVLALQCFTEKKTYFLHSIINRDQTLKKTGDKHLPRAFRLLHKARECIISRFCLSLGLTVPESSSSSTDTGGDTTKQLELPNMKENSCPRIFLIILSTLVFVVVLVINALAGAGKGEFQSRNVELHRV